MVGARDTVGTMALFEQAVSTAISRHTRDALAAEVNACGMRTRRGGWGQISNAQNLLARLERDQLRPERPKAGYGGRAPWR